MERISCEGCEYYYEEEEYRYCMKQEKYLHYAVECEEENNGGNLEMHSL